MDDLIGFLVFLIVMGISIASKFRSDRKGAGTDDQDPDRPLTLDELPESTRRMLYGEGEIIVAKPRQPVPDWETPRPVKEAMPAPVPARQIVLEQSSRDTTRPLSEQPARPPVTLERRPLTQAPLPRTQQQPQAPRMQPRNPQQSQQVRPPRQKQRQQERPHPQQPAMQPARPASISVPAEFMELRRCRKRQRVMNSMKSRQGLANAVLLREILGPPRALEPWTY